MDRLIKYARREPTAQGKSQVCIYNDRLATKFYANFQWWSKNKPRKNQKSVEINCYRWKLIWLPDA